MFCYFYLLADFLKTMKNTRFFASFLAKTKKKNPSGNSRRGRGIPSRQASGAAANLPTEREEARGRETAPSALPRDKQKYTALPSVARAAKPRGLWSERGQGNRRVARHKGSEATAPISGAARRRSPNDRRAVNSRTRFQTPTARRGQGARGISSARNKLPSPLEMREGGALTGSAAEQAGSRQKPPEAQAARKDSDESAPNSGGAQGADGGAERSRPPTKRDPRSVH